MDERLLRANADVGAARAMICRRVREVVMSREARRSGIVVALLPVVCVSE